MPFHATDPLKVRFPCAGAEDAVFSPTPREHASLADDASSIITYREFLSGEIIHLESGAVRTSSDRDRREISNGFVKPPRPPKSLRVTTRFPSQPTPILNRAKAKTPHVFYRLFADGKPLRCLNTNKTLHPCIGRLDGTDLVMPRSSLYITRQILKAENLNDKWYGTMYASAFDDVPVSPMVPLSLDGGGLGLDPCFPLAIVLTLRASNPPQSFLTRKSRNTISAGTVGNSTHLITLPRSAPASRTARPATSDGTRRPFVKEAVSRPVSSQSHWSSSSTSSTTSLNVTSILPVIRKQRSMTWSMFSRKGSS